MGGRLVVMLYDEPVELVGGRLVVLVSVYGGLVTPVMELV